MNYEWKAPCKEHPFVGYCVATDNDGTVKATATIPLLEWARVDRERVKDALEDYLQCCEMGLALLLKSKKGDDV